MRRGSARDHGRPAVIRLSVKPNLLAQAGALPTDESKMLKADDGA